MIFIVWLTSHIPLTVGGNNLLCVWLCSAIGRDGGREGGREEGREGGREGRREDFEVMFHCVLR